MAEADGRIEALLGRVRRAIADLDMPGCYRPDGAAGEAVYRAGGALLEAQRQLLLVLNRPENCVECVLPTNPCPCGEGGEHEGE
jgi:hypothetical protein